MIGGTEYNDSPCPEHPKLLYTIIFFIGYEERGIWVVLQYEADNMVQSTL